MPPSGFIPIVAGDIYTSSWPNLPQVLIRLAAQSIRIFSFSSLVAPVGNWKWAGTDSPAVLLPLINVIFGRASCWWIYRPWGIFIVECNSWKNSSLGFTTTIRWDRRLVYIEDLAKLIQRNDNVALVISMTKPSLMIVLSHDSNQRPRLEKVVHQRRGYYAFTPILSLKWTSHDANIWLSVLSLI